MIMNKKHKKKSRKSGTKNPKIEEKMSYLKWNIPYTFMNNITFSIDNTNNNFVLSGC
jgi:hypothetical protein